MATNPLAPGKPEARPEVDPAELARRNPLVDPPGAEFIRQVGHDVGQAWFARRLAARGTPVTTALRELQDVLDATKSGQPSPAITVRWPFDR